MISLIISFLAFSNQNPDFLGWLEKNGQSLAPTYQTRNCVEFAYEAYHRFYGVSLVPKDKSAFFIANATVEDANKVLKYKTGYAKIAGCQTALVNAGLGKAVSVNEAKPGDLIQYWFIEGGRVTWGHACILKEITKEGWIVIGSQPENDNNNDGIYEDSDGGFGYFLIEPNSLTFVVRPITLAD